jgi:hypothetical protein
MNCLTIASIASAAAGLVVGLFAAYYWWKASKIEIDPGWRTGPPQSAADALRPIEPADGSSDAVWLTATMKAASDSAYLNKRAALLTAVAVVFSALSGVLGALAGSF